MQLRRLIGYDARLPLVDFASGSFSANAAQSRRLIDYVRTKKPTFEPNNKWVAHFFSCISMYADG
jgi:hypothetical protein